MERYSAFARVGNSTVAILPGAVSEEEAHRLKDEFYSVFYSNDWPGGTQLVSVWIEPVIGGVA